VLPLRAMLATLRSSGFSDWVSIEDFSTSYSDLQKLSRNYSLVRSYMGLDGA
jgi:sugar phosphate isomerase/epimerase